MPRPQDHPERAGYSVPLDPEWLRQGADQVRRRVVAVADEGAIQFPRQQIQSGGIPDEDSGEVVTRPGTRLPQDRLLARVESCLVERETMRRSHGSSAEGSN